MYVGGIVQGTSRPIALETRPNQGNNFSFASLLPAPINSSPAVEGTPFLTRDGLALVFYSERSGGAGDRDLYFSERTNTGEDFSSLVRFVNVNSAQRDHAPWLSLDALTLYYSSRRASSDDDIWSATRSDPGVDFPAPVVVTELNSSGDDTGITLSDDGLVAYFATDRSGGLGGMDLSRAARSTVSAPFSTPELVAGLNTSADDGAPQLTADRQELFFVSTRNGGDSQLFRVSSICP
jgi:Tol biopolymer transport system component